MASEKEKLPAFLELSNEFPFPHVVMTHELADTVNWEIGVVLGEALGNKTSFEEVGRTRQTGSSIIHTSSFARNWPVSRGGLGSKHSLSLIY